MKKNNGIIAVAVILGLLLVGAVIWGVTLNSSKQKLQEENTVMTEQIDELAQLRADLEQEVDSLQEEYQILADENQELAGTLDDAQAKLVKTERALRNANRAAANERNSLKAQIQELIEAKAELQMNIEQIQAENDSLRMRTGILEQDLAVSEQEKEALSNLNKTIESEVKRLTLANFKASGFKVSTLQKNEKVTSRARRARTVDVNFDLANVPSEYQGVRTIYLSITDESGTPIAVENPIMANIMVNGQEMDLVAVKAKEVNIGESQRLSFTYELEDKLNAGLYRATVYTDIGLLGASSFQLR